MKSLFLLSADENDALSMRARTLYVPEVMVNSFSINSESGAKKLGFVPDGGMNVLLAASEGAKLQFGNGYSAIKHLTTACHAINATRFTRPSTDYSWFDSLEQKFNIIKSYANKWVNDIAIEVTATIPSNITTFNNTFQSHIKVIQGVTQRYSDFSKISESDLCGIRDILTKIITKVDTVNTDWNKCKKRMEAWKGEVDIIRGIKTGISGAKYDLQEGSENIQKAARDLSNDIAYYNSAIDDLNAAIEDYRKKVGLGAGLVTGGLCTAALGLCFCVACPVVGGIMLVVGIGMIIGGAVVWAVYQKKINDAYKKIAEFSQKIQADTATLTSLNALATASDSVVQNVQTAIEKMTDVQTIWGSYGESLKAVHAALEAGKKEEIAALLSAETENAKLQWETLADYSQELLASTDEVKIVDGNEQIVA